MLHGGPPLCACHCLMYSSRAEGTATPADGRERIRRSMRHAVCDHDIDSYGLREVAVGERARVGYFETQRVLPPMLERLLRYDVLGVDGLRTPLDHRPIARIRKIRASSIPAASALRGVASPGAPLPRTSWPTG
jgi:hypothetical protein